VLKIRNVVVYDKFKYSGKIIKEGDRFVIANTGRVAFLETETRSACFHRVRNLCCDKPRLKVQLRTETNTPE
jgi:hypothetical protein